MSLAHIALVKVLAQFSFPFLNKLVSIILEAQGRGLGANSTRAEAKFAAKLLRSFEIRNPTIFDVGANKGEWTNEIRKFFPRSDFYCFEPSKSSFNSLTVNFEGITNIHLYNFGLGETDQITTLYYDQAQSGLASLSNRRLDHFGITMGLSEQIELRNLDEFIQEIGGFSQSP